MGVCIAKLPHKSSNCNSRDGLQVFEEEDGKVSGYCFSCNTYVNNPYGKPRLASDIPQSQRFTKSKEQIEEELEVIKSCTAMDLKDRKLRKRYLEAFGIKIGLDQSDGKTPKYHYYPYYKDGELRGYKVRLIKDKRMWSVGDQKDVDLFGWEQAKASGAKKLLITEGELDAVALLSIIERETPTKYDKYKPAVVSLPHGAASAGRDIGKVLDKLSIFKEVVLVFDDDKAGKAAINDVLKILPDAVVASLPAKDANACIVEGKSKEAYAAVTFNSKKKLPTGVKNLVDLIEDALTPVEYGYSYPWPSLTQITYGQRLGEMISVGGGVGCGKTTIAHELLSYNASKHGLNSLAVYLEETNAESLRYLCGKVDGIPYHVPDLKYDVNGFRSTAEKLSDHITLYDSSSSYGGPEDVWEGIKMALLSMHSDVDVFVLDNMTALTEGLTATEKNEFIGMVAKELADIAIQHNILVVVFSHLNAPTQGPSHENGGKVLENQFTGSRALMRWSSMMFGFERNKLAKDPSASFLRVLKNRKYGKTGVVKTYYEEDTGNLIEKQWHDAVYEDDEINRKG